MRPSVRGAEALRVVSLLAGAGVLSAAAVGLLAGIGWAVTGAGPLSPAVASALAVGAVAADALASRMGRPRPLAVRRQVPQLWGRLFGLGAVAVLYGTRLGVGPLTILATWTWWAALVAGASLGPWPSAAVGAVFAIARTLTMLGAVAGTRTGPVMASRLAAVRRAQPWVGWLTAVVLVLAAAACQGDDGEGGVADSAERREDATELVLEPSSTADPAAPSAPSVTTTSTTPPVETGPEAAALNELLLEESLPGFDRADDRLGAGPLDLAAAAALEADTAAERALLETRGFRQGLSRAWLSPAEDVAYLAVYRFADPAQAAGYLADGAETLTARGAAPFPVPELPGATGFTTVEEDSRGTFTAHAVTFTRGPDWFLVLVGSLGSGATSDDARALALRQAERVPAADG